MLDFIKAGMILACASLAQAQYGPGGQYGPDSHGGSSSSNGGSSSNPYSDGGYESYFSRYTVLITAHAVLATLAFGLLFPVGGIMIRLASFPGLWWVHGLFQTVAYILYIAAFAIGVYMVSGAPSGLGLWHNPHPIIGTILFVLLFFQPILGFLHHTMFKKHSRRVVWSYGHIWLGRIGITLGIINGGLGLRWARTTGFFAPSTGTVIAYGVVAGLIWLLYMASAIYGEMKRKRSSAKGDIMPPPTYREMHSRDGRNHEDMPQYA